MKIYLAARYSRRDEMVQHAMQLRHFGHFITSRWLLGHDVVWSGDEHPEWTAFSMVDLCDVDAADTVISFTHPRGTLVTGGGRHVEFGYGYAKGKRMVVIGEREHVFHHLPGIEIYPDLDAWLEKESGV